jgi:hypothetical protein
LLACPTKSCLEQFSIKTCCPPPLHPQPAKPPGGFGVLHLLLVALLAFLIGHFANVAVPLLTDRLKQL